MISIRKANNTEDYKHIETLAHIIWHEHYTPIIGKVQVDYMLDKFQTVNAIISQIKEEYCYYLLKNKNDHDVGYFSIKKESNTIFISKFYVLKDFRKKGIGKTAIEFIQNKAQNLNCTSISLTVNKNNTNSINAYKSIGFQIKEDIVTPIGNGFVMNDYKMEKTIIQAPKSPGNI